MRRVTEMADKELKVASTERESVGLAVYVRTQGVGRVGVWGRVLAGGIAVGCFAVLGVAAWVSPDGRGVGTHEQLGLQPCGMMVVFGLPCPTCGYTTSFAMFARGRWLASFWNQPAGFLGALIAAMTAWGGVCVAVWGWRVEGLLGRWFTGRVVVGLAGLVVVAWGWKMVLVRGWG